MPSNVIMEIGCENIITNVKSKGVWQLLLFFVSTFKKKTLIETKNMFDANVSISIFQKSFSLFSEN